MFDSQSREERSKTDRISNRWLFATDAIGIPPNAIPEHGVDEIATNEQKDYDVARWTVKLTLDALMIDERWYEIARADWATKSFKTTKTWLFHKEDLGTWSIVRQIWNLK